MLPDGEDKTVTVLLNVISSLYKLNLHGVVCVRVCMCVCVSCARPVKQRLEQIGRPQGVRLHTAHVLCMDAILNVGLEMGSHNYDCWPHVFRLEHTHTHTHTGTHTHKRVLR